MNTKNENGNGNENLEMRLDRLAGRVAERLAAANLKCVFAESCTGGKMAAAITTVPGISNSFCGSAVTYREATKTEWLQITPSTIQKYTAESEQVTIEMAVSVLEKTPEADVSIAITGHLGPGEPEPIDGVIFVCVVERDSNRSQRYQLQSEDRKSRQTEAACHAFEFFLS